MKKIFIGIGIGIGIIVAIIAFLVYRDIQEENKLAEEVNKIVELTEQEEVDFNEINKLLNRIVTKRDYVKVEEAIKEYLKDGFNVILVMHDVINADEYSNILATSNYQEDGPNFIKTKKFLQNSITTLEQAKVDYREMLTTEKIMSYINEKNVDKYYKDYYKELAIGEDIEVYDKEVEKSLDEVIKVLNQVDKVIDFLIKNKESWYISGENIVLETDELVKEYNNLVSQIGK